MPKNISKRKVVAISIAIVVIGCDTGVGPDESGGSEGSGGSNAPSVERVEEAALSERASTDDFSDSISPDSTPSTLQEALEIFSSFGNSESETASSALFESQDSTEETSLADQLNALFDGEPFVETENETSTSYAYQLSGSAEKAGIDLTDQFDTGTVDAFLDLDIDLEETQEEIENETQMTVETSNSGEGGFRTVDSLSDNSEGLESLDGFVSVAANLNAAVELNADDTGEITSGAVAYSASMLMESAASIVVDNGDGGTEGGHFYVAVSYTDDLAVTGNSEQELGERLEAEIENNQEYEITLKVWKDAPDSFDDRAEVDESLTISDFGDSDAASLSIMSSEMPWSIRW